LVLFLDLLTGLGQLAKDPHREKGLLLLGSANGQREIGIGDLAFGLLDLGVLGGIADNDDPLVVHVSSHLLSWPGGFLICLPWHYKPKSTQPPGPVKGSDLSECISPLTGGGWVI